MKHPLRQRHHSQWVEWIQAFVTLFVLTGIYYASDNFEAYTTQYKTHSSHSAVEQKSSAYWNDNYGYGFRWVAGDLYLPKSSTGSDQVLVKSSSWLVFQYATVQVSFYPHATIDAVEKKHTQSVKRAYSRLPNGIAVIEWDLASATAKTVLATLHAR
jgi:hypothetical protein